MVLRSSVGESGSASTSMSRKGLLSAGAGLGVAKKKWLISHWHPSRNCACRLKLRFDDGANWLLGFMGYYTWTIRFTLHKQVMALWKGETCWNETARW